MPLAFTVCEKQTSHLPFASHLGNKAEGPLYLGWYESIPSEGVSWHIWVLLGVWKVKLILDLKVKNMTLLELGRTEVKCLSLVKMKWNKKCDTKQIKGYLREKKKGHKILCNIALKSVCLLYMWITCFKWR